MTAERHPGTPVNLSLARDVVKAQVLMRAWLGRCEWCGKDLPADAHHRLAAAHLGQYLPWVLAAVSRRCHDYIHAHPVEARDRGFIVESCDDPATKPVLLWNGMKARLDEHYGYEILEWNVPLPVLG